MAGPVSMALGRFAFQAVGFGYDKLQRNLDTRWASVPVAGRFDALHWTGPQSDAVTIKGVIFPEAFGGLDVLEGLRQAAMAGEALMLATLDGQIRGLHVIEAIDEDRSHINRTALPGRLAYTLRLKRYVKRFEAA